jgi:hypothetical protein
LVSGTPPLLSSQTHLISARHRHSLSTVCGKIFTVCQKPSTVQQNLSLVYQKPSTVCQKLSTVLGKTFLISPKPVPG